MAHELKAVERVVVHQALHGYADGHRQLAISTTLKPRDHKTLLALSDISGAGARLDDEGYLTGYPLPESGVFALARTWPAPEMPRPGCVWTHTLLVDFSDLAVLPALTELTALFRRPAGFGDTRAYAQTQKLNIAPKETPHSLPRAWTRQILAALYEKPKSRILVGRSGQGVDGAILAVWSQQWPRLRRNFRFCTLAVADRSAEGAAFDLQLVPSIDRSTRGQFGTVVDADNFPIGPATWIESAYKDLVQPDTEGLRTFLHRLGSDVTGGREAFRPLCKLHDAIREFAVRPDAVREAIRVLQDELGPREARAARAIVVSAALDRVEYLDDESFEFFWRHLGELDQDTLASYASRIGRTVWGRDPARLSGGSEPAFLGTLLDRTLSELDEDELIEGLMSVPTLAGRAIASRPELVSALAIWQHLEVDDIAFDVAVASGRQAQAMAALLEAGRSDLAPRAVQRLGAGSALRAVNERKGDDGSAIDWVRAVAQQPEAVATFLASEAPIRRPLLLDLARTLHPDAVPNEYGTDPWLIAWGSSTGSIGDAAMSYLTAYLFARALGLRSRSSAELSQFAFERTHYAAATDQLSDDGWRLVEPRLPRTSFWFNWDRCQRLRLGVVDLFVDRDLPPSVFARIVRDGELFESLVIAAARSGRGRSYLKHVKQAIKDEADPGLCGSLRTIEKILD